MIYAKLTHGACKATKADIHRKVVCATRTFPNAKEFIVKNTKPTPTNEHELLYTFTEDDTHIYEEFSLIPKGDTRHLLTLKDYEDAVQNLLDTKAQELSYDTIYTCIGYWNSTNTKFRTEARSASKWRDAVWVKCHEILNAWNAGTIEQPTVEDLLAQLPPFTWATEET